MTVGECCAPTSLQIVQAQLLLTIAAAGETLDEEAHDVFVDFAVQLVAREAARHLRSEEAK
jgi:hypothetical protein